MTTNYDPAKSSELIRECRERAEKATPGPWRQTDEVRAFLRLPKPLPQDEADAAFIASSRLGWPATAEQLEAAGRRITDLLNAIGQHNMRSRSDDMICPSCLKIGARRDHEASDHPGAFVCTYCDHQFLA